MIASAVYNVNRDVKKHPEPIEPMFFFEKPVEKAGPSNEELCQKLEGNLRMIDALWQQAGRPT